MLSKWRKGYSKASSIKKTCLKDRKLAQVKFYKNDTFKAVGLLFILTVVLTYLISPVVSVPHISLRVGDICPKDIKAPRDFQIEDQTATIKRQKEAETKVLAVYDFDDRLIGDISQRLNLIFDLLKEEQTALPLSEGSASVRSREKKDAGQRKPGSDAIWTGLPDHGLFDQNSAALLSEVSFSELPVEARWEQFKAKTSLYISLDEYRYLARYPEKDSLRKFISKLLNQVMGEGILGGLNFLPGEDKNGFIKRNITSGQELIIKDITQILDEKRAKNKIEKEILTLFPDDQKFAVLIAAMVKELIYPNVTLNLSETRLRKTEAVDGVKPSFFQIKKGEMIIREGEKVTESHVFKLSALMKMQEEENVFLSFLGLAIVVLLSLVMLFFFVQRHHPSVAAQMKYLLLIALVIAVTVFFNRIFIYVANGLSATVPTIEAFSYFYAFPFASAAMLIALLLDAQIAVMVAAVVAIFSGLLLGKDFYFVVVAFFGSLGAIYGLVYMAHRIAILRGGLMVSLANLAIIAPLDMIKGVLFTRQGMYDCLFGLIGGLVVATLVSSLLPLFESLFKLTTDIKLLELSNMNQPILRRLATEAPGTYHHSIIVGNLAEAASEAIGANSLLARVAASYHDIGKVTKPRYFVENQMNFKNEHEKLSPSMSGLILISHVKEGVELAKQYKLCPAIVDIINQHHGTSLQKFFYKKAKDQEEREEQKIYIVKEGDYRYPGPKPQTKEAGIIMLADAVEAASRTLSDPSPSRIQGLILTLINNVFNDGQLDECELTLKDLHQIAGSFNRIITGIFHQRIPYPDLDSGAADNGKKEKDGDSNQKSTKESKNKSSSLEEDDYEDLKRIGISGQGGEYTARNR